jgi:hypothetical protein
MPMQQGLINVIKQKSTNIRKLAYRSARHSAAVSIHFVVDGATFDGSCHDVSESGARARFNLPVPLGIQGLLTLHYREGAITRRARVACVEDLTVGLSFLSDETTRATATITLVAKPSNSG